MAIHEYEVGGLLVKKMREFLKVQKFIGNIEDWAEQKGFLSSTFHIKAPTNFLIELETKNDQ